ncbi:MAG TPA: response regulator [Bryobacteraceae bacterium]|nr:response regulator [Bryobacteraceae bacterium]
MSRILLADDSPHAQRMGERILRDEGHEVVTVTDGDTAVMRLADADPDLILADAYLPGKSGYDVCEYAKKHPRHRHARVVLIAGLLEHVDEELAQMAGVDLVLKKPFEASAMIAAIRPLIEAAEAERAARPEAEPEPAAAAVSNPAPGAEPEAHVPPASVAPAEPEAVEPAIPADPFTNVDAERVRAAIVVALDRAMPTLIDELTGKVLIALGK